MVGIKDIDGTFMVISDPISVNINDIAFKDSVSNVNF